MKSIDGINVAGITSILDNIYINLVWYSQENIFKLNIYLSLANNQGDGNFEIKIYQR